MVAKVHCSNPGCGQHYGVPEEQLGHTAVCKKCQQPFTECCQQDRRRDVPRILLTGVRRSACVDPPPPPSSPPHCLARRIWLPGKYPEKIGRFEVRARLGAGAFGAVYRAYDPMLDREVALKVPHASAVQSETRRARVVTEAKAAGQLRHPNIVPVYEAGRDGDISYIVSAFIEGQTLEDAIEGQRLDFRRAAKLVMDLAGALHYAHRRRDRASRHQAGQHHAGRQGRSAADGFRAGPPGGGR